MYRLSAKKIKNTFTSSFIQILIQWHPSAHLQEQQKWDQHVKDSNPHSADIRQPAETEKEKWKASYAWQKSARVTQKLMTD